MMGGGVSAVFRWIGAEIDSRRRVTAALRGSDAGHVAAAVAEESV